MKVVSAPRSTSEPQWGSPTALIVNGIGDHLIALPALRALASMMQGRLRLLCLPGARELFFSDLALAAVHCVSFLDEHPAPRQGDYAKHAVAELAAAIGDCDLFMCFDRRRSPSTMALLRALK